MVSSGAVGKRKQTIAHFLMKKCGMDHKASSKTYKKLYSSTNYTLDKLYKEIVDKTFSHDQFSKLRKKRSSTPEVYISIRSENYCQSGSNKYIRLPAGDRRSTSGELLAS